MMILTGDLSEYFGEQLRTALKHLNVRPQIQTELYLTDLLSSGAAAMNDDALVEQLASAEQSEDRGERIRLFRGMGDSALYRCGFFAESSEGRGVSLDYIASMGARGYGVAASLSDTQKELFRDLAEHFNSYARILDEVREMTTMRTPQDIVKLYDRWQRTRSPKIARRLHAQGLLPTTGSDEVH